ncbi:hypothetical protein AKUH3B209X_01050 [Apilactobacillus kunkeei]|nr:hypothetical protein AKUH3B209X_01050 [Apilactobacillus kunkeei]
MVTNINLTDTTSKIISVEGALGDTFNIPFYQRNYAWEEENAESFLNDVIEVVKGNQNVHFFGQVVSYRNGNVKDLIDGQQRITTSCIYLAALKKIASEIEINELSQDMSDELRDIKRDVRKYTRYDSDLPTLTLQKRYNDDNSINEYFRGIFDGRYQLNSENRKIKPIININKVFNYLYKNISKYIKLNCDSDDYTSMIFILRKMFDSFTSSFFFSIVETHNQDDAFIIFETLNSTGKDLAPSEIIKTYLLSQMSQDENISAYNDDWNRLDDAFNSDTDTLTAFIRIYWGSRYDLVKSKTLYRSVSSEIKSNEKAQAFLSDLLSLDDYYIAANKLPKSNADLALIGDPTISSILDLFRKIGSTVYFPVLFSMKLRKYSNEDIKLVLYKVLSVFVRHALICGYITNRLESGFANIAQKIYKQKLSNVNDILNELNDRLMVSDREVRSIFPNLSKSNGTGKKGWTLKYFLLKFLELDDDIDQVRIDTMASSNYNVLPIGTEQEVSEDYMEHLGNYVLIEGNISSEISMEHTIEEVLDVLKDSKFQSNIELYNYIKTNGWSDGDVEKRQEKFAEKSISIWK